MNALYPHVLAAVYGRPWAIHPDTMGVITDILEGRIHGARLDPEEIEARLAAAAATNGPRAGARKETNVQVIPVYGAITPRAGMMANSSGGTSVESVRKNVRAALADPSVGALVLDIDSPGGDVAGIPELGAELLQARSRKPLFAVANSNAFSAAYWLGSAASEFYVTPSGSVGSIGVVAVHEDHTERIAKEGVKPTVVTSSKYKAERSRAAVLTKEARADIQAEVDAYHAMFLQAVADGRGVTVDTVAQDYGEGRTFVAKKAEARGMVDGVATLEQVIQRAGDMAISSFQDAPAAISSSVTTTYEIEVSDHNGTTTEHLVLGGGHGVPSFTFDVAPVSEPFAVRLQRVLAEVEAVAQHAQERAELRAEEGRTLSTETRERLTALQAGLVALLATQEPVVQQQVSVGALEAILKQYELEAQDRG